MTLADVRFGLVELLTSNAGINAIVAGRVFPVVLRQGETRDSIVYNRITEFESLHMTAPTGLVSARFQIDACSVSHDAAQLLADLVKEQLGGFSGRIEYDPPSASNHVDVQLIELINGRDDFDNVAKLYRMSRDYFIWYEDRNA